MGVFGRPHGIKGEAGADWHGSSIPKAGDTIHIQTGESPPEPRRVISSRMHKGRLLLTLEGINDRTQADLLKGSRILLARDSVPEPEADEVFVQDLPGCDVYLPENSFLGTLDHVEFPAGQMIWAIKGQAGNEILFPAEPCFIVSLDMDSRKVVIDPPAGLLDIYSA